MKHVYQVAYLFIDIFILSYLHLSELFIIHSSWNPKYFLTFYNISPVHIILEWIVSQKRQISFFFFFSFAEVNTNLSKCVIDWRHNSALPTTKSCAYSRSMGKALHSLFTPVPYRSLLMLLVFLCFCYETLAARTEIRCLPFLLCENWPYSSHEEGAGHDLSEHSSMVPLHCSVAHSAWITIWLYNTMEMK